MRSASMATLDNSTLQQARLDLLSRSGGIVAFPVAGALYWLAMGICGYTLDHDSWRIVALIGSAMLFPTAFLLATLFKANIFVRDNPLASLAGLPMATVGLLPFALYIVLDGSAIQLLPLALAIGMSLHFPILGWMYGSRVCALHPIVRTASALGVWMIFPGGRFTILPLVVMVIYVITAPLLRAEIVRARIAQPCAAPNGGPAAPVENSGVTEGPPSVS